jgi:hypothetical protein
LNFCCPDSYKELMKRDPGSNQTRPANPYPIK